MFSAIKCRTNQKVGTSEGVLPHDFRVHHKSHIEKELYIVLILFLPTDNGITRDGLVNHEKLYRLVKQVLIMKITFDSWLGYTWGTIR